MANIGNLSVLIEFLRKVFIHLSAEKHLSASTDIIGIVQMAVYYENEAARLFFLENCLEKISSHCLQILSTINNMHFPV